MANASIRAAFERMWQHITDALNNKIDFTKSQTLTDEQKAQARENIGAGVSQIQSDWNQNDNSQLDYVKNRTHYEEENLVDIAGLTYSSISITSDGIEKSHNLNIPFELGQIWVVEEYDGYGPYSGDGQPMELEVQEADDGTLYIGTYPDMNLVPFYITANTVKADGSWVNMMSTYSLTVRGVSGTYAGEPIIHQLDPKYIPDSISRVMDWTEENVIETLAESDMLIAVQDSDGSIIADENGNILSM